MHTDRYVPLHPQLKTLLDDVEVVDHDDGTFASTVSAARTG